MHPTLRANIGDEIRQFKVDVPHVALEDLRQRLGMTRWPERETASNWSRGVPLDKMMALVIGRSLRSASSSRRIERPSSLKSLNSGTCMSAPTKGKPQNKFYFSPRRLLGEIV